MLITRNDHKWQFTPNNETHITLSVEPFFLVQKKKHTTFMSPDKFSIQLSDTSEYLVTHNIILPIHVYEHLVDEQLIHNDVLKRLLNDPIPSTEYPDIYECINRLPKELSNIILPFCEHLNKTYSFTEKVDISNFSMLP